MSWKLRAAISALLLAPQAAFPLGLGDIRLNSALNEPLSAEIELVAPTAEELGSLSATLASRELFQRLGIDRAPFLDTVHFEVGRGRDGRNVLLVSSAAPISEPFVTFVVEVNWPRGRLMREYTVLLDPPVFAPAEAAVPTPVAAPRTPRAPAPAAPAPAAQPRPIPEAGPAAAPAAGEMPSSYSVRNGDTLYDIAAQYTDGSRSNINRMIIAMYRENPEAFGGNINVLRAGSILRVPGPDALNSVGASEASSEIGRQTAAWKGDEARQEPARLRLVTPEVPADGGTPAAGTADVETRIGDLNREIEESRRLLELKSAELAQLQQQLSEKEAAAAMAAAAPPATEPPAPATEPAAPAPEAAPAAPPAEAPAEKPAEEKPPVPPVAQEPGFVDKLTDNWTYVLGAAVLLLGGGLAIGYVRRRREEDLDDALRTFDSTGSAPVPSETQRLRALAVDADLQTNTEEQEEEDFRTATLPPVRRTDLERPASFAETFSAEAPVELDQGDPLAEADFHMAYGLYDQAADIVKLALDGEPGRRDLKMKLLEIYFVAGNKAQFLETAEGLSRSRSDGDGAEWDRVVIMGRQLAPENALFAGQASSSGVDLNLEGGAGHVDLELLAPPEGDEGLDFDLGEALEAADGDVATGETEALDFDLDAEAPGEAPTAEMPRVPDSDVAGATAEMPTLETRAMDAPTVQATRLQANLAETTAEMPMDDLGIDLGDLDALQDIAAEDDVTRIAPADDSTAEMPATDPDAMDFDLSDMAQEVVSAGETVETAAVDLDVGASLTDRGSDFTATEQISLEDLPEVSELEPVTMSEVGTKLDLARAYVDMGDPDGARSILDEVLKEGSNSQKQEAQRLLDSLPGA
jgi:pilus assembly protein FimV